MDDFIAVVGERIVLRRQKAISLMQKYFNDTFHLFFDNKNNVELTINLLQVIVRTR